MRDGDGVMIEVGGQDIKVIQLMGDKVKKFLMNDKCAAGMGRFLASGERATGALARGNHPRRYSPGSAATSPIFSRLSTKSAMSAADCSHTKTRSRLSIATSFTMPALTSWRIASFVAP